MVLTMDQLEEGRYYKCIRGTCEETFLYLKQSEDYENWEIILLSHDGKDEECGYREYYLFYEDERFEELIDISERYRAAEFMVL